jgi:predicted DCC family thiol-disulfide oxidoreductase YuxK
MDERVETEAPTSPILFFDGVCNMCNRTVDFVIRRDTSHTIRFAPLQGETAKTLLPKLGVDPSKLESVVYVHKGVAYTHSRAVMQIGRAIGGVYRVLAYLGYLFPNFLRNWAYNRIANNRYSWFGKKETCRMPTPEERARFLP